MYVRIAILKNLQSIQIYEYNFRYLNNHFKGNVQNQYAVCVHKNHFKYLIPHQ